MHIHILGICGTFMAGLAQLAQQMGHTVEGSDANIYPPMSTQLKNSGIKLYNGYNPEHIDTSIDAIIVGNVIKRGNPMMEYILDNNIPYISGPQWLAENVLQKRWVLAVAGTHGKTTTSSVLAWILHYAGKNPGFLIGGVPENFEVSAQLGSDPYFVIEADEYDSAFFDKRSKFIHYRPRTLILNNLEYDHADIFPNLEAIMQQFHHLVRTVPSSGLIIKKASDKNLSALLEKGCWTPQVNFGEDSKGWQAKILIEDGSQFKVYFAGKELAQVHWDLIGLHNVENALAALAAAHQVGVSIPLACEALNHFKNVKRRLEVKGSKEGITLYDDFAHHPTAIATTLAGLRAKVGKARIVVVLEFGSYTMRSGVHRDNIKNALGLADFVICKRPVAADWNIEQVLKDFSQPTALFDDVDSIVLNLKNKLQQGDHVVVMSNSGFDGIHQKLLNSIGSRV